MYGLCIFWLQLRADMGSSPRHLFLHHSRVSMGHLLIFCIFLLYKHMRYRPLGKAFCMQIVSAPGPANSSQTPAINISPAWPGWKKTDISSTSTLLCLESEKCFQHRLQCARALCCKTWERRRCLQPSALLLDGLMLYLLPGSGEQQHPGTLISLPARAGSWYILMTSPREPVVAAIFFPQAAECGTCDSGRESWTGFWSGNDD